MWWDKSAFIHLSDNFERFTGGSSAWKSPIKGFVPIFIQWPFWRQQHRHTHGSRHIHQYHIGCKKHSPPPPWVFHSGQFSKSWFLDGHETIQGAKISKKSFIWFFYVFYICSKVFFSFRDPVDPFPSLDVNNFLHFRFQPNTMFGHNL